MTMGPDPMSRIDWRSWRRGTINYLLGRCAVPSSLGAEQKALRPSLQTAPAPSSVTLPGFLRQAAVLVDRELRKLSGDELGETRPVLLAGRPAALGEDLGDAHEDPAGLLLGAEQRLEHGGAAALLVRPRVGQRLDGGEAHRLVE